MVDPIGVKLLQALGTCALSLLQEVLKFINTMVSSGIELSILPPTALVPTHLPQEDSEFA